MFEPNGLARLGRRLPGGPKQLSTCRVARFDVLEVEEQFALGVQAFQYCTPKCLGLVDFKRTRHLQDAVVFMDGNVHVSNWS